MAGVTIETWKDVPGYEGLYQISDLGISIRKLWELGGYTKQELADLFGVSRQSIYATVTRKTWGHV